MNPTEQRIAIDCEYHYDPINGGLACVKNGEVEKVEGWAGHHALMDRFLKLRAAGKITLMRTDDNTGVQIYMAPNTLQLKST